MQRSDGPAMAWAAAAMAAYSAGPQRHDQGEPGAPSPLAGSADRWATRAGAVRRRFPAADDPGRAPESAIGWADPAEVQVFGSDGPCRPDRHRRAGRVPQSGGSEVGPAVRERAGSAVDL